MYMISLYLTLIFCDLFLSNRKDKWMVSFHFNYKLYNIHKVHKCVTFLVFNLDYTAVIPF